jgi:hypothetical protein
VVVIEWDDSWPTNAISEGSRNIFFIALFLELGLPWQISHAPIKAFIQCTTIVPTVNYSNPWSIAKFWSASTHRPHPRAWHGNRSHETIKKFSPSRWYQILVK